MECKSLTFLAMGQAPHWLSLLPYLHLRSWSQGGSGRCVLLNAAKTWNTTRINIASTILAFLKEKCFLPYFSITCTVNAKAIMVKKKLSLLQ